MWMSRRTVPIASTERARVAAMDAQHPLHDARVRAHGGMHVVEHIFSAPAAARKARARVPCLDTHTFEA